MRIDYAQTMKCVESDTEPVMSLTDHVYQLSCYIDKDVKYLQTGLKSVSKKWFDQHIVVLLSFYFTKKRPVCCSSLLSCHDIVILMNNDVVWEGLYFRTASVFVWSNSTWSRLISLHEQIKYTYNEKCAWTFSGSCITTVFMYPSFQELSYGWQQCHPIWLLWR